MILRCSFFSFIIVALATMIGCSSSDESVLEDMVVPEPEVVVEPEPEPDWVDNTLTIKIGRSQTGTQLLGRFNRKKCVAGHDTKRDLSHPDFPMAKRHYTIEIKVISMPEVGMTKPTARTEVQRRYKEAGYRPLTMEEAVELRLQFPEQPDMATGHEMAYFYVLPSNAERDIQFCKDINGWHDAPDNLVTPVFVIQHNRRGLLSTPPSIHTFLLAVLQEGVLQEKDNEFFDPFHGVPGAHLPPKNAAQGARFACIISEWEGHTPKTHE